jgi:hypothetical protein
MTYAAKAVATSAKQRSQHWLYTATQRQIRVSDNAGACSGPAAISAGAHGRDAVDELGLTDRPHLDRARIPVH